METIALEGAHGTLPTLAEIPEGDGPFPGVVVVHDALGMSHDLGAQVRWLAAARYLAAAPDLFAWGGHGRCLFRTLRDMTRGDGRAFEDLELVRGWLSRHPKSTGRVGIVGFCMGGGFALMLAPGTAYAASAVNYGGMSDRFWARMAESCPIVASYGAEDGSLKGEAERLERVLADHGIPHDVKVYPGVGHGFMNDHDPRELHWIVRLLAWMSNTRYDARATEDARRRIVAFFDRYLRATAA
jgi:carboxymethylenebutenolidase